MKRNQILVLLVLSLLCVCVTVGMFLAISDAKSKQFVPPLPDANAVAGTPTDENLSSYYYSPCKMSEDLTVCICGVVRREGNEALVYFSNVESNTALVRLAAFSNQTEIATTGILFPGTYVRSITLPEDYSSDTLYLKIITYEPETYYSLGTATISVMLVDSGK